MKSWAVHSLVLIAATALAMLPNLGATSLWDMDEGVNAECGRAMWESDAWIVPTFNGELRTAKPVLVYWLQRFSYSAFGVSEWSARFPSALLAIGTVLATYYLGRSLFDPLTGLLSGIALASALQFSILSHAATPDAPLILFLTLTFALVWRFQLEGRQQWLIWPAIPCGLAVLTKGPVGLVVPAIAFSLFFLWNREWKHLLSWRIAIGLALFAAVVGPWVALVAVETKGEWISKFLMNENVNRVTTAQEHHSGPIYFQLLGMLILFAPWSSFLGLTAWYAIRSARYRKDSPSNEGRATRFLICWFLAFLIPFSLFATKLPNYIAPLYPPLALLTARFLARWVRGEVNPPKWMMLAGALGVALTGLGFGAGMLIGSGVIPVQATWIRIFPGLENWCWIGAIPLVGSIIMAVDLYRNRRGRFAAVLAISASALIAGLAAFAVPVVDRQKAPRALVLESGADDRSRELFLGALNYATDNQSLVFYARRKIAIYHQVGYVKNDVPAHPVVYLFLPEQVWQEHFANDPAFAGYRIAVRKYDFLKNTMLVTATNDPLRK